MGKYLVLIQSRQSVFKVPPAPSPDKEPLSEAPEEDLCLKIKKPRNEGAGPRNAKM